MNSYKPIVTVVTATYNKFGHLFQTMLSVLEQSYPKIQYIISDDGSECFPQYEIEDFIRKNNKKEYDIRVMHHEKNNGTVKNLNLAYKQGCGEYYINLSCGDVFFDDKVVERIVNEFINRGSNVLVTSRILYKGDFEPICYLPHYDERKIISGWSTGLEQYKAFITGMSYDMASGSAMHFSKEILERIGYFDEKYVLWEDGPFIAKYLQIGRIDCAYDIISIWYESGGGSDNRKKAKSSNSPAKLKLLQDTMLFDSYERLLHLDQLNNKEKRIINLKKKRIEYRDSWKRYFLYVMYLPEYILCKKYSRDRKYRYEKDMVELEKVLVNNPRRKGT